MSHGHQCCRHSQNQRIQSGTRLGIASGAVPAADVATPAGLILNQFIDGHKLLAWNFAEPTATVARLVFDASVPSTPQAVVSSDADQELLVYLPFTEFIRLRGIAIVGGGGCTGPAEVSLFTNQPEMHGFDSVQRLHADECLELVDASDDDELIYLLDATKFMSVGNLTILVHRNFTNDDDVPTQLRKILLFGESSKLPTNRPIAKNVVYELRGNPADHPEEADESRKRINNLVS